MKILAVCLGNICRSPLAEGLLRKAAGEAGYDWQIDSAGTGAWHVGERPDPRSIAVARANELDITTQRARQVSADDLTEYDLILAMDDSNYRNLLQMARTEEERRKIHLILEYADPQQAGAGVPDPYWDDNGFERVYRMLEEAARSVVRRLASHRNVPS